MRASASGGGVLGLGTAAVTRGAVPPTPFGTYMAAFYDDSVFINCPFDAEYQAIFRALVFSVQNRP